MQLSEVDHPPCWPDRHTLLVTASGCLLTDGIPGDLQVALDEPRLLEVLKSWIDGAEEDFIGVMLRADLAEAVDDFINLGAEPAQMLDWALHLELLAAKLRVAAG